MNPPDSTTHEVGDEPTIAGVPDPPTNAPSVTSGPGPDPAQPFQILAVLDEGGMGTIHVVRDSQLRRKAAYKQMKPKILENPDFVSRFLAEAQITAQLDHPNIVPVYALDAREDGTYAYHMKLVEGRTLRQIIDDIADRVGKRQPLEAEDALEARLEVFLKLCDAVEFAHSRGVIHRDLKPPNVMVGLHGEVYLMDWGIARLMDGQEELLEKVQLTGEEDSSGGDLTAVGQAVGTPRYMSPEQAAGQNAELDGRSDLYALGIILFELVSLKRAVGGQTQRETHRLALAGEKEELVHLDSKTPIPTELHAIIEKATALEPADRYGSVLEMAQDIRRYLRGEAVKARPDTPVQAAMRWFRHNLRQTIGLAMVLLLGLATLAIHSLVSKQTVMREARQRELRLTRFQTAVTRRSQQIDSWFLRYEERTRALAESATELLTHGKPSSGRIYSHSDFRDPRTAPPDLMSAPLYRTHEGDKQISLGWPGYKVSPGVDPKAVEPLVRRLMPLERQFRQLFLDSRTDPDVPLTPVQQVDLLTRQGVPIRWAYIGLVQGLMFSYPGKTYADDYDARRRPWYQLGKSIRGRRVQWGSPHFDAQGQGLTLTCVSRIGDAKGKFAGTAALDVTFDYIIKNLLQMPNLPGVEETYLLNDEGKVVVRTSDLGKADDGEHGLKLEPFEIAEVYKEVRARRSGILIHRGKGKLFGYFRLNSLGWTFVVRADTRRVLDE